MQPQRKYKKLEELYQKYLRHETERKSTELKIVDFLEELGRYKSKRYTLERVRYFEK